MYKVVLLQAQAVIFIIIAVLALSCVLGKCGSGALAAGFDSMYTDLGKLKLFFNNYTSIKAAEKFWTVMTFIVCVFDFILFIIFLVDAVRGHGSVSPTDELAPAPKRCRVITGADLASNLEILRQTDKVVEFNCEGNYDYPNVTCVNGEWYPDVTFKAFPCYLAQGFPGCDAKPFTYPSYCRLFKFTDKQDTSSVAYLNCSCSYPDILEGSTEAICAGEDDGYWLRRRELKCVKGPTRGSTRGPTSATPPLVCLIVASKGFVFWIFNIAILIYFVKIMKNVTRNNCPCTTQDDSLNTNST